jgi:hypothetical protein
MNRIYQGRVAAVQIPNPDASAKKTEPWVPLDSDAKLAREKGETALWDHHVLFQDAVNYYIVCLLALARPGNPIYPIREKLDAHDASGNPDDLMVWRPFRRRGATRAGLRDSVAKYLTPGNAEPTPEDCFAAALAGNVFTQSDEDLTKLDAGLRQLLNKCTGDSGCRNAAPEFLPRLCKPNYRGNYGEDTSALSRDNAKARLPFVLHEPNTRFDSLELDEFSVHSIALPNERKPAFCGSDAKGKLREMVEAWRTRQPEAESDWARLSDTIGRLPDDLEIPGYAATSAKGEVKFRLFAMFLFRHVEKSAFTFGLLRATTPKPAANETVPARAAVNSSGDPIRLARGQRGYVFRAFTSLPCWDGNASGTPQWIEFDCAAFEEALKALHQVDAKAEERRKARELLQAQHDFQRGRTKKWKGGSSGEDDSPPPLLIRDPRIARLEALLSKDKASGGLAEEYEMAEGVSVEYGLQQRTIRGFRDVRKIWNDALQPDDQYSPALREKLWKLLTDYKRENAQTMGSPVLFDAMVEEPNWLIWREPTKAQTDAWRQAARLPEDAEFAKDPLQALTDERELLEEIRRLEGPIRFTPADPVHSRRQFYFSDVSALDKKNRLRHDRQTVDVEIAVKTPAGQWQRTEVRLHFTAPRLLRDQLNSTGGKDAAFQQAMMTALGLSAGLKKTKKGKVREASFAECAAVALMPEETSSGERRILLNFPLKLEDDAIARQLGKAARWDANQFGPNFKNSSWLRWPSTPDANAKAPPWWTEAKPFRCLSADLGQRDTAAFAIIEASPGQPPKPGQSRKLGEAGGHTWWATVRATGMLRLPGEDAQVIRDGQWQEEFSGERGRLASEEEWQEARDICAKLGLDADRILGTDPQRHSFPELNDQLLYALRRAQGRLARLQSWSCIAHTESKPQRKEAIAKQLKAAVEELLNAKDDTERDALVAELRPFIARDEWPLVASRLIQEVERLRAMLPRELERLADRVQPLRGRRWEWVRRDGANYVLRQTEHGTDNRKKKLAGQRGLSLERIEQLESLRQRCQSLNRALRQTPGEPAKLGKSKRGIELPDPCPELLDRLDALKEQRVNQTAHLLLAQALGVRLRPHQTDAATRMAQNIHGEYERIPGREPVDFLVLENLDRYLASQGRSRGENSKLMKWCHRAMLGKLKQLCEPYGLRVLETPAAYSSRFCSLTGVAGFRAVELTPAHARDFRWKKHLDRLQGEARGERKLSAEERNESERVRAVFRQLEEINRGVREANPKRPQWRTLLAPVAGGPIFIPASPTETHVRKNPKSGREETAIRFKEVAGRRPAIIQSDINAAINLGLRALAAPDATDIHLRIRAARESEAFAVRAENLREKARWGAKPPKIQVLTERDRESLLAEARLNFFTDLGGVAEYDHATIDGQVGYASGRGIWGTIKSDWWKDGQHQTAKDWQRIEEINRARLRNWESAADDVPM